MSGVTCNEFQGEELFAKFSLKNKPDKIAYVCIDTGSEPESVISQGMLNYLGITKTIPQSFTTLETFGNEIIHSTENVKLSVMFEGCTKLIDLLCVVDHSRAVSMVLGQAFLRRRELIIDFGVTSQDNYALRTGPNSELKAWRTNLYFKK